MTVTTNEIHLNGNNSTVQTTSAHETSEVQVFNSPIFGKIRVSTDKNGDPLFCLVDICTSIGIVNHRNVKNRLDKDDVRQVDTPTGGGSQSMVYVTESGMYDVILRSDSPKAKPFKKWVSGDVLPTIRKTGSYSIQPQHNIPQTYSDALLLAANQARQIENLKKENHLLVLENNSYREKAEFADSIMQSKNCITIGEMANILNQNKIFRKGRNALYGALRQKGYLLKRGIRYNLPTQKSISEGIMRVAEIPSHTISGITINRSAVITPKGQQYFIKMFRKLKGDKQFSLSF